MAFHLCAEITLSLEIFTFPQRRELQSICKVRTCKRDEKVLPIGVDAKTVVLVESGCFVIRALTLHVQTLKMKLGPDFSGKLSGFRQPHRR